MVGIGSFYGQESLPTEFKKFCLDSLFFQLPDDEVINIINSNKITDQLNDIIRNYLYHYIKKIFPKYFSSFLNAKINGKVMIGIDDEGYYRGIPLKDSLNANDIYDFLSKISIQSKLSTSDFIKVEIKKLTIESIEYIESNKQSKYELLKYQLIMEIYQRSYNQYKKEHKGWERRLNRYSCALETIMNSPQTRLELMHFIPSITETIEIKKLLKSDKFISMNLKGYELEKFKSEEEPIIDSIYYWLLKFQKHMKDVVLNNKPVKPYKPRCKTPNLILSGLNIIDKDCNYYVVIITINGAKYSGEQLSFFSDKKRKNSNEFVKIKRIRGISSNGPSCQPVV